MGLQVGQAGPGGGCIHGFALPSTLGHSADLWIVSGLYCMFGVGCYQMVRMVLAGTTRATTLFCVSLLQRVSLGTFLWESQGTKTAGRHMQGLVKLLLRSCLLITH